MDDISWYSIQEYLFIATVDYHMMQPTIDLKLKCL